MQALSEFIKSLVSRPWYVMLLLFAIIVPPYTSKGYPIIEAPKVTAYLIMHPMKSSLLKTFPLFNMIAILMFLGVLLIGAKLARLFSLYVGFMYILVAIVQNISITKQYGFGIVLSNITLFLVVSLYWFSEVYSQKNDFSHKHNAWWKYVLLVLALLAFWYPANPETHLPDFSLLNFWNSGSGLAFCMLTGLFLAQLLLYHPHINHLTLRITSFVGLLIGLGNIWLEFVYEPSLWWLGILHIPLVVISSVGLILSLQTKTNAKKIYI
jgi:hypothetical protein